MLLSAILNLKVSFQRNTWAGIGQEIPIAEVLKQITSDTYKNEINKLRALIRSNDLESYGIHKKTLPCVTFCGTFNANRRKEDIKTYNSLIVIDIDKLDAVDFLRVKSVLESNKFVLAFWESPSGNGFKGLISLEYEFDPNDGFLDHHHKRAFQNLANYFLNKFDIELDESGSDTTRLCFLTYDINLKTKDDFKGFTVSYEKVSEVKFKASERTIANIELSSRDLLFNPKNKNSPINRKTIQSIIKFLIKHNLSITESYEEWYRVAYAIASSFTYDLGEKYFFSLSKLDIDKFNETNCRNMLNYAYSNSSGKINFSSIIYYANQQGYLTSSQKREVSKVGS